MTASNVKSPTELTDAPMPLGPRAKAKMKKKSKRSRKRSARTASRPASANTAPARPRSSANGKKKTAGEEIMYIGAAVVAMLFILILALGSQKDTPRAVPAPSGRSPVVFVTPPSASRSVPTRTPQPRETNRSTQTRTSSSTVTRATSATAQSATPTTDENGYERLPGTINPQEMAARERQQKAPVASWLRVED